MSSNVGLTTPRGSGTSGYIQRNLSALKPRSAGYGQPYQSSSLSQSTTNSNSNIKSSATRKPNQEILRHDRLREIEVAVAELRARLEDEVKLDEEAVEEECERLRGELVGQLERTGGGGRKSEKRMKGYQVHEMAEAKERESERLRRALGLGRVREGEEGEHPMARQGRLGREREEKRERERERAGSREREGDRDGSGDEMRRSRRRRYSDD